MRLHDRSYPTRQYLDLTLVASNSDGYVDDNFIASNGGQGRNDALHDANADSCSVDNGILYAVAAAVWLLHCVLKLFVNPFIHFMDLMRVNKLMI